MSPAARKPRVFTTLSTAQQVIDVLGRNSENLNPVHVVAKFTGAEIKSVYHWHATGVFPSRMHDLMSKALRRRGYKAPPALWKQATKAEAA